MPSIVSRARSAAARVSPQVWRILAHSLLFGLAGSIADLLFNFYLVSLGYGADTAGLMATVYRGAGALLGLPIGLLIDRFGPRVLLIAGAMGFGLAYALLLLASQLWALAAIVFLAGIANVLALTAVVPLLTSITSSEERPTVFGMNASAALIIGLAGSSIGGLLPGLAAGILNVPAQDTAAYRLALTVVVVLGIISPLPVMLGFRTTTHTTGAATTAATPQRRQSSLTLIHFALPSLLLGIGGGLFLPFQNLYFRSVWGLSDAFVGAMLAVGALGMGLGALLGSPVAARMGLRQAASVLRFATVLAVGLMFVPFLPVVMLGYILRGTFIAASYPLNDALVMKLTPAQQRGAAVSLLSVLWSLGWSVSAWVSGQIQVGYGFMPVLAVSLVAYGLSAWAIWTIRDH